MTTTEPPAEEHTHEEEEQEPEQEPEQEQEIRCTLCGLRACWTR